MPRSQRQNLTRINQARLTQLEARDKERYAKNPVTAVFSDMFGEGADELGEATRRTFSDGAAFDDELLEETKRKVGYKSPPKEKAPWEMWAAKTKERPK